MRFHSALKINLTNPTIGHIYSIYIICMHILFLTILTTSITINEADCTSDICIVKRAWTWICITIYDLVGGHMMKSLLLLLSKL